MKIHIALHRVCRFAVFLIYEILLTLFGGNGTHYILKSKDLAKLIVLQFFFVFNGHFANTPPIIPLHSTECLIEPPVDLF